MRPIDADVVIHELTEMVRHNTGEYKYGLDAARLVVMDAPTIGGWTRVEDGMPELEGDYWVTDGHHVPWKCRMLILAGTKGWVNGAYNPQIKYWMPMPELPKEDEVG